MNGETPAELAALRSHATSLAEDLDDAGATIADYRDALSAMQRERDEARADASRLRELLNEARIAEPVAAAYAAAPSAHQESADALYRERAHLVAFLSSTWPALIGPAHDVDEEGWAIVYIDSPAGQMTWHIAPRDLDLFGHLRIANAEWDGHSTAEKYQRLDKLTQRQASNSARDALDAQTLHDSPGSDCGCGLGAERCRAAEDGETGKGGW